MAAVTDVSTLDVQALISWITNRLRQKNGAYFVMALGARALNAFGMFVAIKRFLPTAFGEMGYLQATAVSAVAFTSFGIELSINAQLSRKRNSSGDDRPTIAAGACLASLGIALACLAINFIYSSQLKVSGPHSLTVGALCVFCSFMIVGSLINAVSFAYEATTNIGIAYIVSAIIFITAASLAPRSLSGTGLLLILTTSQFVCTIGLIAALFFRIRKLPHQAFDSLSQFTAETLREIKVLFRYGTKQIIIVSVITFSQWLIQRKIVFGEGGTADNAIYSIGNQVFNIMTFIPTLLGPVIVSRMAAAGTNIRLRRQICIASIKLFAFIALAVCIGTFFGLRVAVQFLPARYAAAVATGTLAAVAASFQILKAPFSLFFLSELRASREIISSVAGAMFMIAATSLHQQVEPNTGTVIRLLGCALQATLLTAFFLIESRATKVA